MGILEDIWKALVDFFETYFWSVDSYDMYNPINTIVYTILALIGCWIVFQIVEYINRKGIEHYQERFTLVKPNKKFFLSIIPYIFLGSTLRALRDTKFIPESFRLLETPWIYVLMILLTLFFGIISIFVGIYYSMEYYPIFFGIGLVLEIIVLIPLITLIVNPWGGILIIGVISILFLILFGLNRQNWIPLFKIWFSNENVMVLTAQLFDTTATFISLTFFSYLEMHVLPNVLFGIFDTWVFYPAKFLLVFCTLLVMDSTLNENEKQKEIRSWLKWVIFLLGLATGSRDTLRLITLT